MNRVDLEGFRAGDLTGWRGLPADLTLTEVLAGADDDSRGHGLAGEPPVARTWHALPSARYEGGLLAWTDGDRVVLLEGEAPVDDAGEPVPAPDLGPPDDLLDTPLGRLWLEGGEQVHAARGLALRVNPANGLLLGVLGFAPTTPADYRERLRPHREPRRLLTPSRVAEP